MRVIRTKVRMRGRMVAEVQGRTSPAYLLSDMLHPRIFDHVVEAVDALTNQSPQLGKQLSYFVKEVARLKVGLGTRRESRLGEEMVNKAEKFLKLYDASWSRQVLRRADRKIKVRRLAQLKQLPLSEDVNNISVWLKKTLAEAEENKEGRMHVAKLVLTVLITFNRRRPSECAELWWSEVEKASIREEITEILNSVSYAERTISGRYGLFVVA